MSADSRLRIDRIPDNPPAAAFTASGVLLPGREADAVAMDLKIYHPAILVVAALNPWYGALYSIGISQVISDVLAPVG